MDEAKRLGCKTLLMGECGHAYRIMKMMMEGGRWWGDLPFEITNVLEWTADIIKQGKLEFDKSKNPQRVTYHDPCDLGRNSGVYDAPRNILRSVPGLTFVELEKNQAESICCGGGGNLEMADANLSGTVAQKKIEEIQRTGARTVVTSCQQCVRTIKSRARRQKIDLNVMDITELVLQAMSKD